MKKLLILLLGSIILLGWLSACELFFGGYSGIYINSNPTTTLLIDHFEDGDLSPLASAWGPWIGFDFNYMPVGSGFNMYNATESYSSLGRSLKLEYNLTDVADGTQDFVGAGVIVSPAQAMDLSAFSTLRFWYQNPVIIGPTPGIQVSIHCSSYVTNGVGEDFKHTGDKPTSLISTTWTYVTIALEDSTDGFLQPSSCSNANCTGKAFRTCLSQVTGISFETGIDVMDGVQISGEIFLDDITFHY